MSKNVANSKERHYTDLSVFRRWALLILVSAGSSILYIPPYLRWSYPTQMLAALHLTNVQLGFLMSAYAWTALICYLPAGFLADKVRMRTLSVAGFLSTAVLLLVYATLPSFTVLMFLMVGLGITTILIWWGTRYKLIRLLFAEEEYGSRIGWSYMFYGIMGYICAGILFLYFFNSFSPAVALRTTMIAAAIIIACLGFASFAIPKFDNEFAKDAKKFSINEFVQAIKNKAVLWSAVTMFLVYFVYTSVTYTTQWLGIGAIAISIAVINATGTIRNYGVTIVSSPLAGSLTKKIGSPSKVIMGGFVLAIVILLSFQFLPWKAAMGTAFIALAILLGFIMNGIFAITSGQLSEAKVPLPIFGAASGILSLVGFLPDTFRDIWFGKWVDADALNKAGVDISGAAYHKIFWVMVVFSLLGMFAAYMVLREAKKIKDADDTDDNKEVETAA